MNVFDLFVKIGNWFNDTDIGTKVLLGSMFLFMVLMVATRPSAPEQPSQVVKVKSRSVVKVDKFVPTEHKDTSFIYYRIPNESMSEFFELERITAADTTKGSPYANEANQNLWQFLRETCNNNLEVYENNGLVHVWTYKMLNSNNVIVTNTYGFGFNIEQHKNHFVKYKTKIR